MVRCLTGARFTMKADVLRWEGQSEASEDDVGEGTWESYQDPITGEILNRWVPGTADDPDTAEDETASKRTIDCVARGVMSSGVRAGGSSEQFGDIYTSLEYIRLEVPSGVEVTKRERITNVREAGTGKIVWKEPDGSPTVFNVSGYLPMFDPFNRHTHTVLYLDRAEYNG